MKILFIISCSPYDDFLGGAENFVKHVAELLSKKHEVHVLTKKVKKCLLDYEEINNIHLHRFSPLNIPKLMWITEPHSMYKTGLKVVKDYDIDVIVPCILHPTGAVGVKIGKKLNKPSFLSLQNIIFRKDMNSIFSGPSSKFALKNATKIHVISKFLKDNLSEYVNRAEDDIILIYDGVDIDFFDYKKVNITKSRKKYTSKFPLIACVSHFKFPQKRQDLLVRSMVKIREKYPDALLLLVGAGDNLKIKNLIDEIGLNTNVKILGPKSPEDVREIMAVSDVFAFITAFEGMGIVAVETLAMGTPIVATNVGPLPELIRDGKDGILTSLDVDDISDGIIKVVSNEKMRSERIDKRKWVEKNFNWTDISRKVEKQLLLLDKKN